MFVGGFCVGRADLASVPSGGAWNKSLEMGVGICTGAAHSGYLLGRSVVPQLSVRGQCWVLEARDAASSKLMSSQGDLVHSHYQLPGLCVTVLVFWHGKLGLVNVGEIVGIWVFCICQYLIQGANKNYPGDTGLVALMESYVSSCVCLSRA